MSTWFGLLVPAMIPAVLLLAGVVSFRAARRRQKVFVDARRRKH
jgi:hypothetical protein